MFDFSEFTLTQAVYSIAALVCATFVVVIVVKRPPDAALGKSIAVAAFVNTLWLVSVALFDPFVLFDVLAIGGKRLTANSALLFMETLHYCVWSLALTKTAQKIRPNLIPKKLRFVVYIIGFLLPPTSLTLMSLELIKNNSFEVLVWHGVIFSVLNLLIIEQFYRSCYSDHIIRVFCIALGLNFLFDAALFSQHLAGLYEDPIIWQIRACVVVISYTMMIAAFFLFDQKLKPKAETSLAEPAIFYSTSLSTGGLILVGLATAGYYIQLRSASWVILSFAALSTCLIALLALTFTSSRFRRKLNVFINKHLFNYKYDYRSEWLKLIKGLAQAVPEEEVTKNSIRAVATLFRCKGAAVLVQQGTHFIVVDQFGDMPENLDIREIASSEFSKKLASDYVFAPNARSDKSKIEREYLPAWCDSIPECWIAAPLLIEEKMMGILILSHPVDGEDPDWEDFDLIKTVGRQIANYLTRHHQAEQLAEARQFEAFNKLSAFMMHDLKNLIAQQSLVVKNAKKHKDNPAFVEDAINTIKNSVDRMNNLLMKLQQTEPAQTTVIPLKTLLLDATKRCQKRLPVPTLGDIDGNLKVKADHDSLMMVFTHIIQNAQDATANNGFVDIYTETGETCASIFIEDNGEGMTDHFIRTKLFRPFESTKMGKGMGVGVYQAKEYLESVGGNILVESEVDKGTKFTLKLPIADYHYE